MTSETKTASFASVSKSNISEGAVGVTVVEDAVPTECEVWFCNVTRTCVVVPWLDSLVTTLVVLCLSVTLASVESEVPCTRTVVVKVLADETWSVDEGLLLVVLIVVVVDNAGDVVSVVEEGVLVTADEGNGDKVVLVDKTDVGKMLVFSAAVGPVVAFDDIVVLVGIGAFVVVSMLLLVERLTVAEWISTVVLLCPDDPEHVGHADDASEGVVTDLFDTPSVGLASFVIMNDSVVILVGVVGTVVEGTGVVVEVVGTVVGTVVEGTGVVNCLQ